MSDSDDIDSIRERKREELIQQTGTAGETGVNRAEVPESNATPDEPIHIEGAEHLDEVTGTYDVVLADFYADWCGPCQMVEPIVKTIAKDTDAVVVKVDVDRHQRIAQEAGVRGVPTIFLYVDDEPVERLVGVQDEGTLRSMIEQYS